MPSINRSLRVFGVVSGLLLVVAACGQAETDVTGTATVTTETATSATSSSETIAAETTSSETVEAETTSSETVATDATTTRPEASATTETEDAGPKDEAEGPTDKAVGPEDEVDVAPALVPLVAQATNDLANRLGISIDQIAVALAEMRVWSNGAIGCPQDGMIYTQALVDGTEILLDAQGKTYRYTAGDGLSAPQLCEQ